MKNYKKKYNTYASQPDEIWTVNEGDVMPLNKCLFCYKEIEDSKAHFHQTCNKKFFGQLETPVLDYKFDELDKLAEKIIYSKMAVTGVQPKISLSLSRKEEKNIVKKLTIVGLYGDYILKPPSEYYLHLPEVEDLTMHLANVCGLKTVPHSLIYLQDKTLCYITKRVDRTKKGMLHMEDMCQLNERLTEDKYKGSHEQIAKTIMKYSASPLLDVTNFYELIIFSYLTGNADMHLKNFSLIEKPELNGYILSPFYDLLATAIVNPKDNEELALTLNGKKSNLKYEDFLSAYSVIGLSKKVLDVALDNFFSCMNEMQKKVQESFISDEYKKNYEDLLSERTEKLLRRK